MLLFFSRMIYIGIRCGLLAIVYVCSTSIYGQGAQKPLEVSAGTGIEEQQLKWSIAGDEQGLHPNILSEVKWKDLKGSFSTLESRYHLNPRLVVSAAASFGWLAKGEVFDNDYEGDNRTRSTYKGVFRSTGDHSSRFCIRMGYRFLKHSKMEWVGWAGAGWSAHYLNVKSGGTDSVYLTEGLNSSYRLHYGGPLVGTEARFDITSKFKWNFLAELEPLFYSAAGNWNLVTSFQHPKSFEQVSRGEQVRLQWQGRYRIGKLLDIYAALLFQRAVATGGEDALYLANGTVLRTHFNGMTSQLYVIHVGLHWAI
jgi:Protochlamydia outer membrane protein